MKKAKTKKAKTKKAKTNTKTNKIQEGAFGLKCTAFSFPFAPHFPVLTNWPLITPGQCHPSLSKST